MQKEYKTLLFDLDDTLIDDDENRRYAIKKILTERKEELNNDRIEEFIEVDNQFWKDRVDGKIKDPYEFKTLEEKTEWVRAQRFIIYFDNITLQEAIEINNRYMEFISENAIPIKNAVDTIKYLYKKGYEIYVTTNGPTKSANGKLEKIGVRKYIKYTFSAEKAGHMKPSSEFFNRFFEKINNYKKEEMLIIGDDIEKDIEGGIRNGIDTCWFNHRRINSNIKANYEIYDLLDLKKIL